MTTAEFIKLVEKMRDAQTRYFKAQNGSQAKYSALNESKALERQVDDCLAIYNQYGQFENPQQELF